MAELLVEQDALSAPRRALLEALAAKMVEPETTDVFLNTNPKLFAGFTFIGQFIDHDITLDTTPLAQQLEDQLEHRLPGIQRLHVDVDVGTEAAGLP